MNTRQIQALLTYLGYDPGEVDGVIGRNTRRAVLAFQAQEGLTADGSPGPVTQAALLEAVAAGRFRREDAKATEENTGTFWDHIRYFDREEFRCRCGGRYCDGFLAEPSEALVGIAEALREQAGAPITVSSGVRCQTYNDTLSGSVKNSQHIVGKAMDFCIRGWASSKTLAAVRQCTGIRYAYAIDGNYVHMDIE